MFSYQVDEKTKLILPMPHHAEQINAVVRENLEHLRRWMPWATNDYSVESAQEFIKNNLEELSKNNSFNTIILHENLIAGAVGFNRYDSSNKSVEIGYWLKAAAQGNGIVTKSCRTLINYAFDDWKLNRIQVNCNVENVKSRAVPERLGFKLEGIRRQVEFLNNQLNDWAIYGMLKEEWKNNGQSTVIS